MGKGLSYLKKWDIGVNYCWNYGLLKLLLQFVEYRLDQLNNKHTKIAVNWTIQRFESRYQKKCLGTIFDLSATNRRLFKIFAKLNGNHLLVANIFKLHEYQTFGSMKMHNMSKMWKPIINSVFETVWLTMNEPPKMLIFKLFPFSIFWISNGYFQKYCGKTTLFYNAFRMFLWSSTLLQIFLIHTFDNETTVLLKVFEIC